MITLDLFSGIGGFSLAAGWVWGDELKIVSFVENEKFCQKILRKHWPLIPIHDDIKTFKGDNLGTVDLITGGFPCQPFSVAGKRGGKEDNRYLWPEMLRIISEIGPTWVVAENVTGIVNMELDQVCVDLENEGYEVQPFIIPACSVNAPHRRDRVWIIGNSQRNRFHGKKISIQFWESRQKNTYVTGKDSYATHTNRQGPQIREMQPGDPTVIGDHWQENWAEVATRLCGVDDGLSTRLHRTKRLKALGNSIVVPVVVQILEAIKSISG